MEDQFYCKGFMRRAEYAQPSKVVQTPVQSPAQSPAGFSPGPEWSRPGELPWSDALLRRVYCDSRGAFYRAEDGGFSLAYPLSCRSPFPLPTLFCFARAECLGSRGWWVFSFTSGGLPRLTP